MQENRELTGGLREKWGYVGLVLSLNLFWGLVGWLLWRTQQPPCNGESWMSNRECNKFMMDAIANNYMTLLLTLAFFAVPALIAIAVIKHERGKTFKTAETHEKNARSGVTGQREPANIKAWELAERVMKRMERQNSEARKEREQLVKLLYNAPTQSNRLAPAQRNKPSSGRADDAFPPGKMRLDR